MREDPGSRQSRSSRARWIGAGFVGAFAASVFTVIYTGLNVEGSRGEFDSGFRSVTMTVGEVRTVELVFDLESAVSEAALEVTLPSMVELADPAGRSGAARSVAVTAGENIVPVDIRAKESGSGYLVGRLEAREPIGLYRVFLTVGDDG